MPSRRSHSPTCAGCGWPSLLRIVLVCCLVGGVGAPRPPRQGVRDPRALAAPPVQDGTARKRTNLLILFEAWLSEASEMQSLETLARADVPTLSQMLREFGFFVFSGGWTRNQYVELVLAMADRFEWLRPQLGAAWRLVQRWEQLEPSEVHTPVPLPVLRGLVTAAISWGWLRVGALLMIGFWGLLRPIELCSLRRCDVLLPGEHSGGQALLIRISAPKRGRGRGARKQYSKVDETEGLQFVCRWLNTRGPEDRLWTGSPATFSKRFGALATALVGSQVRFTPAGLRAGGATTLFQLWGEDLPRIQWRGRWRDVRTLPHYLQELQAAEIMSHLAGRAAQKVITLSALFAALAS